MKFSHTLDEQRKLSPVEWGPFFLNYKVLEKKIEEMACAQREGRHHTSFATTPEALASSQREIEFFRFMDHEILRGAKFLTLTEGQCALKTRNILDGYRSTRLLLQSPSLGLGSIVSAEMATEMWVCLLHACIKVYEELILLNHWVIVNYYGFSKILEKHDKRTGFDTKRKYLRFVVAKNHFISYPKLHSMLRDMEGIYANISRLVPDGPERMGGNAKLNAVKDGVAAVAAQFATHTEELTRTIEEFYHGLAAAPDGMECMSISNNGINNNNNNNSRGSSTDPGDDRRTPYPPRHDAGGGGGRRSGAAAGFFNGNGAAAAAAAVTAAVAAAAAAPRAAVGDNQSGTAAGARSFAVPPRPGVRREHNNGQQLPLTPPEGKRRRVLIEQNLAEIGQHQEGVFAKAATAATTAAGPLTWSSPWIPTSSSGGSSKVDIGGSCSRSYGGSTSGGGAGGGGSDALKMASESSARATAAEVGEVAACSRRMGSFMGRRGDMTVKVRVSRRDQRLPRAGGAGAGDVVGHSTAAAAAVDFSAAGCQTGVGDVMPVGSSVGSPHPPGS